jgi:hypothetical protein
MYARDLTGTHVEMRCLRELVQHKLPRLAAHMDALGCDMSILATGGCVRGAIGGRACQQAGMLAAGCRVQLHEEAC